MYFVDANWKQIHNERCEKYMCDRCLFLMKTSVHHLNLKKSKGLRTNDWLTSECHTTESKDGSIIIHTNLFLYILSEKVQSCKICACLLLNTCRKHR